jgi:predicted  nucleic acid-binding Zn-ribbon protein
VGRLEPLLAAQALDVETDRLGVQRAEFPERATLRQSEANLLEYDRILSELQTQRDTLAESEKELAVEVSDVAAHAREIEENLYSGQVTASRELENIQEELRLIRTKQAGLEDRELEIMEEIEAVDTRRSTRGEEREACAAEIDSLKRAIHSAEEKIASEIDRLRESRQLPLTEIPPAIVEAYEELRGQPRLSGRGAAEFSGGVCKGCRLSLPRIEASRLMAEPEDALICCSSCGRVLVR